MKHNEHFMAWLNSLRNEALKPETTMTRTIEILKIYRPVRSVPIALTAQGCAPIRRQS